MTQLIRASLRSQQDGLTMIEALVALLVLSIGLLGVAALQMASLRNNHSAHMRSQATALAYDIADRMRANRTAALNGDYDIAVGATPNMPSTLAEIDLAAWKTLLQTLPAGDGSVARDGNVLVVTVEWDDSHGVEAPVDFVTRTQL